MGFYDQRRSPSSSGNGNRKQYQNADGPGGSTIDYGQPRGKSQDQRYREAREKNGDSRWFGREGDVNPMPLIDEDTPFWTPNAGDPRNAGYFVSTDPAAEAARDAAIAADKAKSRAAYNADPAYAAAKSKGDLKAQIAAMMDLKNAFARNRFIAQGGTGDTWDNRFETEWPVPASRDGTYQYGPGRPGPTPPGVAQSNGGESIADMQARGLRIGGPSGGGDPVDAVSQPLKNWMSGGAGQGAASTGANEVLAALARVQSMPIGAPTAATGAPGGFAKAAAASVKKPTIVRRGGGRVDQAAA